MRQFLSPATLLLVVLFFPGLSRVTYADQQDTEGPRGPKEGSPGRGTRGSHPLRHQVERRLLPRTPPFPDIEPDFKVVNCKRGDGRCQKYCNYMELQLGYCSKKKEACCLPQN
ncbi:sperm-associated antigen 11B-like [Physeter macrocephalus]|uniref:Sperm-associated antigen 11B-like n=1 Tax=Physeter macrocephalus TaxID=9755 RepID=A0A455AJY7_PHYMC|nr:sperm-associated antigen 11B-like [Physeter catodon]|eukprot:XP_028336772.1 sperm-associated antigen 11-like [Physeter catodon]